MMMQEYDKVKTKIEKNGFPSGSVGVIVSVYEAGEAYEVEVWDDDGYPVDVVTYCVEQIEKTD